MIHRKRLVAVLAALALSVAACGDDDDDGGGGNGDAGLADLGGQTVEVAAVWTGAEQEGFEAVLQGFEDETGASVKYTSTGDDIATVLGTRVQGGNPPDVAVLPQPGLLKEFAGEGSLQAVSDDVASRVDENYATIWKDLGTVDGTLYGVWFKAANKSTVWYRTDAFDTAGVEPPTTWDEFVQVSQTVADSGTTPLSVAGGDGWTLTDWFENVYLSTAGPEKYDQLTAHEIPWTDQSVIDTLTTLSELWGNSEFIVGGNRGALQVPFPQSVTDVFGASPKGAMVYEGDFVAGVIGAETEATVGEDAQFFDFPAAGDAETSVVGAGDVAVKMKDTTGAEELMKWLATPEAAELWAERGGFTSPNKNLDTAVYPDDTSRQIAESLVTASDEGNFRFDMSDQAPPAFGSTPGSGEWKVLQDFLANPSDVQGTAQALEAAAAKAYGG